MSSNSKFLGRLENIETYLEEKYDYSGQNLIKNKEKFKTMSEENEIFYKYITFIQLQHSKEKLNILGGMQSQWNDYCQNEKVLHLVQNLKQSIRRRSRSKFQNVLAESSIHFSHISLSSIEPFYLVNFLSLLIIAWVFNRFFPSSQMHMQNH
ncbi:hypothetical protein PGTUg99_008881 [Puccinia graminis f. sp. tritici]|uniref:Uncharacterized protein n=1 Tax=Puccinia graminis f. sp. tritici TaxID=56615 RepID=A0A5B0SJU2_PUCGR|nr:hypothetical protein PGTUg99_008881 [Puccinia graminis f. sp. tritici]